MLRSPRTVVLAASIFALALGGGVAVLQASGPGNGGGSGGQRSAASSAIWKPGTSWTVSVRQDAGAITPDGAESIATIPFRFRVTDAPKGAGGTWRVHVEQAGAEGPFAAGWNLQYRKEGDAMVLHRVSVGAEPPLEAELAAIVLGPQFPYQVRYERSPKSYTVDAERLLDRSLTPPSALPAGGDATPGATPPAEAPRLTPGGPPATPGR